MPLFIVHFDACTPYSFSLLCSVFRLMPRISAARVLLLLVASSVFRIKQPLGFIHGGSHSETHRVGFLHGARGTTCPKPGGRCLGSMTAPSHTMTARSSVLRSSRTLPGHECAWKALITGSLIPATVRSVFLVHVRQQGVHQVGQVFLVFAQRRHVNVEDVQTVEEVVAKLSSGHRFLRRFVGGGQHANVDRGFGFAAQAAQLAVFQHAQQLGLRGDRHFADFVEQQRAAFGQLKAAGAALQSAGECSFLMAEDFAFDERLRNGGAVDGHERLATCDC